MRPTTVIFDWDGTLLDTDEVGWMARAVASKLYAEDVAEHWQAMLAYDKPELDGSEWVPSELVCADKKGKVA